MKTTAHRKGRHYTTDEMRLLIALWEEGKEVAEIAQTLNVKDGAVLKQVQRLRADGIPLTCRRSGSKGAGRARRLWTQEEVEYLLRRRLAGATCEEIAVDLGRSYSGVNGMIKSLRTKGVPVAMRGTGVKRLWDPEALKGSLAGRPDEDEVRLAERLDREILQAAGIAAAPLTPAGPEG